MAKMLFGDFLNTCNYIKIGKKVIKNDELSYNTIKDIGSKPNRFRKEVIFMCTRNELQIILKKIMKVYREVYGDNIVKVILYGSYSRGDYEKDSDIDIVAIVNGNRELLQKQLVQVWDASSDLELEYETIVSPTVIPYEEYMKYKNDLPYYRNIDREGVIISA